MTVFTLFSTLVSTMGIHIHSAAMCDASDEDHLDVPWLPFKENPPLGALTNDEGKDNALLDLLLPSMSLREIKNGLIKNVECGRADNSPQ